MALPTALSSLASLPFQQVAANSVLHLDSGSSAGVDVLLKISIPAVPAGLSGTYNFGAVTPSSYLVNGALSWAGYLGGEVTFSTFDSAGVPVLDAYEHLPNTEYPEFSVSGGDYYVRVKSMLSTFDVVTFNDVYNSPGADWVGYFNSPVIFVSAAPPVSADLSYLEVSSSFVVPASGLANVHLSASDFDYSLTGDARANELIGNDGYNKLSGGAGDDVLSGGLGDDTLDGGVGNDSLIGGDGNDSLIGGDGVDFLSGGDGRNVIVSGAGNDSIISGSDNDKIDGGDGNDTISSGDGRNVVTGGKGADIITAGSGNDTIDGGDDNDIISSGDGRNVVTGGKGVDNITGGSGDDKIDGGDGNDMINAGDGLNNVTGGKGSDWIIGGSGGDMINGGDDNDTILAGDGNNLLFGGAGGDKIQSGLGNDTIDGGAGIDRLIGGLGNDKLTGGADVDIFVVSLTGGVDTITDFKADVIAFSDLATSLLSPSHFVTAKVSNFTFSDSSPSVGYNTATGALFYDADGSGAAEQFQIALIANKAVLSASNFFVS